MTQLSQTPIGYGDWGAHMDPDGNDDYGDAMPLQQMPEGPCVALPALSLRQPFASLVLYGVKQLEARNRPALKQLSGARDADANEQGQKTKATIRRSRAPCSALASGAQDRSRCTCRTARSPLAAHWYRPPS